MKTTVLSGVLSVIIMLSTILSSIAQCSDYKWPEDGEIKAKAEESLVLLKDNKGNGKQAIPPFNWLVSNTPDLNKSIYIYGAEVYDGLAKKETNAAKKEKYADSLLIIHDLRIKNTPCNEEGSVVNRKALAGYIYYINSDKAKDLMKIMEKAFEMNGNDIMDGTLIPYMQTIQVNKLKFQNLTDEEVIERYDKITEIITAKIKKAQAESKPVDRYKKYQSDVDNIFLNIGIKFDCDQIKKNLEPKYRANPKDIDIAKKIFSMMLQGKCTDDPLWLETGETIIDVEPDYAIIKNLAIRYMSQDNYSKAEDFFKRALAIAPSGSDKADMLIYLGSIEATKKGNKSGAREHYRQALAVDPSQKEIYEKIGDLYMSSYSDCAEKDNYADDRKVYLIAYDYYQKAGDSRKMNQAKESFPSKEELFLKNYQVGTPARVGCWINEPTTWRTRD